MKELHSESEDQNQEFTQNVTVSQTPDTEEVPVEYEMQGEIGRTVDVHFLVDCRTLVIEIVGGNFSQFVVGHGCNRNQRNLHETEIQECFSVFFDITGPGCNK